MSASLLAVLLLLPGGAFAARVEIGAIEAAGNAAPAAVPATIAAPLTLSGPAAVMTAAPVAGAPLSAAPLPAAPAPVLAPALAAPAALPAAAFDEHDARAVFGRRPAAPRAAKPSDEHDASGLFGEGAPSARSDLEALALGLNEAAKPGADAGASAGLLSRVWDSVRDRRSKSEEAFLAARVDSAKEFLRASLDEPVTASRVAAVLRAQRVHSPAMDRPGAELLDRVKGALGGGRTIRLAAPSERKSLGANTLAAAITYTNGDLEIVIHPDSEILRKAPPAVLAATLLHELVHSEFKLGEHAAYLTETAYYARLRSLFPALAASPYAEQLEILRDCLRDGSLSAHLFEAYGAKKLNGPDDLHALGKADKRRTARLLSALTELAAMARDGSWERIEERHIWLAQRLPQEADRKRYFELMEAASRSLPAGTPLAEVFARAARLAQAH